MLNHPVHLYGGRAHHTCFLSSRRRPSPHTGSLLARNCHGNYRSEVLWTFHPSTNPPIPIMRVSSASFLYPVAYCICDRADNILWNTVYGFWMLRRTAPCTDETLVCRQHRHRDLSPPKTPQVSYDYSLLCTWRLIVRHYSHFCARHLGESRIYSTVFLFFA